MQYVKRSVWQSLQARRSSLPTAQGHGDTCTAQDGFTHTAWLGSALLSQGLVQHAQGDDAAARRTLASALLELRDAAGDDAPETVAARAALELLKT
jgi:hypothetical protein